MDTLTSSFLVTGGNFHVCLMVCLQSWASLIPEEAWCLTPEGPQITCRRLFPNLAPEESVCGGWEVCGGTSLYRRFVGLW